MVDQGKAQDDYHVVWSGSPESVEAWKQYKRAKAVRFVESGYSVQWSPDISNHMEIYTPPRDDAGQPEIRASVFFSSKPSESGISGGRILKLLIRVREVGRDYQGRPVYSWNTLYAYDYGPDVDKISESPVAQPLYEAVINELN